MLTVDMDSPVSEVMLASACAAGRVPPPDVYVSNDVKGTLQASWWLLPFPSWLLGREGSGTAWLYARVLESLRLRLHGDPHFSDVRRRNPYCSRGQRVMVSPASRVHRLSDMRAWLEAAGSFDDGRSAVLRSRLVAAAWSRANGGLSADAPAPRPARTAFRGERNSMVFSAAVAAARNGGDPSAAAAAVQCSPPLSAREIRGIVESASRCAARPLLGVASARRRAGGAVCPDMGRLCSEWGRRGGSRGSAAQVRARRRNLALGSQSNSLRHMAVRDRCLAWLRRYGEAALRHVASGGRPTPAAISAMARGLGVSRQTVGRCMAEIAGMIAAGSVVMHGRRPEGAGAGRVLRLSMLVASRWGLFAPPAAAGGMTLMDVSAPPGAPPSAAGLLMARALGGACR